MGKRVSIRFLEDVPENISGIVLFPGDGSPEDRKPASIGRLTRRGIGELREDHRYTNCEREPVVSGRNLEDCMTILIRDETRKISRKHLLIYRFNGLPMCYVLGKNGIYHKENSSCVEWEWKRRGERFYLKDSEALAFSDSGRYGMLVVFEER